MTDYLQYRSESHYRGEIDDPTVELEVLPPRIVLQTQFARLTDNDTMGRAHRRFRTGFSQVGTAAVLLVMVWFVASGNAELGGAPQKLAAVAAPVPTTTDPPAPAIVVNNPVPVVVPATSAAEPASFSRRSEGAARRECMAQVESALLFHRLAKDSASQGAYNVAVNREIKRLLLRHSIGNGRTLDLIGARSWEGRTQPSASPAWLTSQYQRCEQIRSQGAQYLVHL